VKKVLLIGHNISGSLSPLLQNYSMKKFDVDAIYKIEDISPESFHEKISLLLKDKDLHGFNVTIPYKIKIKAYIDELDKSAQLSGAVNCVVKKNNRWIGYNSDISGFRNDINKKIETKDLEIGIIGAGGSARAVLIALLELSFKKVKVFSRNLEKTRQLVDECVTMNNEIYSVNSMEELIESHLIINCTPLRNPLFEPLKFENLRCFYDLNYYDLNKKFIKMLNLNGIDYFDGGGMLINQAAESFKIWFNLFPLVDEMAQMYYNGKGKGKVDVTNHK
jgi:shikimate dehydrogenase